MNKTTAKTLRTALSFLIATSGCGAANGLVDAQCSSGYALVDNRCVALQSPAATFPPEVAWTDTPGGPANFSDAGDASKFGRDIVVTVRPDFGEEAEAGPPPLVCSGDLVACNGQCRPTSSDSFNCGACGKVCPSNICSNGECVGSTPGDVILLGHDFGATWPRSTQAAVLINAMTIPTSNPIRILSYEDGAAPLAVENANGLAAWGTAERGRSVQIKHTTDAALLDDTTLARHHDVVLIHGTSTSDPTSLGSRWAESLGLFVAKGGVLVVIDSGVAEIPTLLTSTGLLSVGSHSPLASDTQFIVSAPADVVGTQLLSPYAGRSGSVSFQGASSPGDNVTWVVRAKQDDGEPGDPVVIHRTVW